MEDSNAFEGISAVQHRGGNGRSSFMAMSVMVWRHGRQYLCWHGIFTRDSTGTLSRQLEQTLYHVSNQCLSDRLFNRECTDPSSPLLREIYLKRRCIRSLPTAFTEARLLDTIVSVSLYALDPVEIVLVG